MANKTKSLNITIKPGEKYVYYLEYSPLTKASSPYFAIKMIGAYTSYNIRSYYYNTKTEVDNFIRYNYYGNDDPYRVYIENISDSDILLDSIQYSNVIDGLRTSLYSATMSPNMEYTPLNVASMTKGVKYDENNMAPTINSVTYPHVELSSKNVYDVLEEIDSRMASCGRVFEELEFGAGKDVDILDYNNTQVTLENYAIANIIYNNTKAKYIMLLYTLDNNGNSIFLESTDGVQWTKLHEIQSLVLTDIKKNKNPGSAMYAIGYSTITGKVDGTTSFQRGEIVLLSITTNMSLFILDTYARMSVLPNDFYDLKTGYATSFDVDNCSIIVSSSSNLYFYAIPKGAALPLPHLIPIDIENATIVNIDSGRYIIYENCYASTLSSHNFNTIVYVVEFAIIDVLADEDIRVYTQPSLYSGNDSHIAYISNYCDANGNPYVNIITDNHLVIGTLSMVHNGTEYTIEFKEIAAHPDPFFNCPIGQYNNTVITRKRTSLSNVSYLYTNAINSDSGKNIKDFVASPIHSNAEYTAFNIMRLNNYIYIYEPSYTNRRLDGNTKLCYFKMKV